MTAEEIDRKALASVLKDQMARKAPGSYRLDFPGPAIQVQPADLGPLGECIGSAIAKAIEDVTEQHEENMRGVAEALGAMSVQPADMTPVASAIDRMTQRMLELFIESEARREEQMRGMAGALAALVAHLEKPAPAVEPPVVNIPERKPVAFRLTVEPDGSKLIAPETPK